MYKLNAEQKAWMSAHPEVEFIWEKCGHCGRRWVAIPYDQEMEPGCPLPWNFINECGPCSRRSEAHNRALAAEE